MQRRSTARATPRKTYTVDAFQGVPELEATVDSEEIDLIDADDSSEDEKRPGRLKSRRIRQLPHVPGVDEAKRRWANDLTLPSHQEDPKSFGGFHRSFSRSEENREGEALEGWSWYVENGGKEAFLARQRLNVLNIEQAEVYTGPQTQISFVMGPYIDQKLFCLGTGQSVLLDGAWTTPERGTVPLEVLETLRHRRPGFMLNHGARARGLKWVPGQDSTVQYLTTSVVSTANVDASIQPSSTDQESPKQSSIRFWRFCADEHGNVDTSMPPALRLVLCSAWGEITSFEWCPIPSRDAGLLGLLALVTEDGVLRVLDVAPINADEPVSHWLMKEAAFRLQPDNTSCTCITWLSPTCIAAGCANGTVHIWNLTDIMPMVESQTVRISASKAYVTSITSCGPSYPHVFLTSSADGSVDIVDTVMKHPQASPLIAAPQPSILGRALLMWHDYSQRAFTTVDDGEVLSRQLRKWQRPVVVSKARSIITSITASPCHPSLLVATADGTVVATNPMNKATDRWDGKIESWHQTWFSHEWRRPTAAEREREDEGAMLLDDLLDSANNIVGKNGLSRILEGFKPELNLPEARGKPSGAAGTSVYTIHEEQTAVTELAWNPNLQCGGWAAAAMANGLIRIEDIAIWRVAH